MKVLSPAEYHTALRADFYSFMCAASPSSILARPFCQAGTSK